MVQLDILNGKTAGTKAVARRFPFRIGRASDSDLRLDDGAVWERHAEINIDPEQGGTLSPLSGAFTSVNGFPIQQPVLLRNGDELLVGSILLRFGLTPTRQRSLRFREALTWIALGALCLSQIALIYWMLN